MHKESIGEAYGAMSGRTSVEHVASNRFPFFSTDSLLPCNSDDHEAKLLCGIECTCRETRPSVEKDELKHHCVACHSAAPNVRKWHRALQHQTFVSPILFCKTKHPETASVLCSTAANTVISHCLAISAVRQTGICRALGQFSGLLRVVGCP